MWNDIWFLCFQWSGTESRGHGQECHGQRQVGVLPELPSLPQLDACPGEAHWKHRFWQGKSFRLTLKCQLFRLHYQLRARRALSVFKYTVFHWEPEGHCQYSNIQYFIESQKGTVSIQIYSISLRARRALSVFKYTIFHWEPEGIYRHAMSLVIVSFWISVEYLWILIAPSWLSTDDMFQIPEIKRYEEENNICPLVLNTVPFWNA